MDEKGILFQTGISTFLPFFVIIWLITIFGTLIGCSGKKKQSGGKKVGESAASVASPNPSGIPGKSATPSANPASNATPGGGANGGKPLTSPDNNNNKNPGCADTKNTAENKDDKKDDKKPDEKPDEKQSEKKEDEKKDDEKKDDDKKESKKEDDKKKEPSNKEDVNKKKSEKPNNNGDKKDGGSGGEKPSVKPEFSTNRTQPSKSVKVKDDDDTVKHIESLKEDKEKSE